MPACRSARGPAVPQGAGQAPVCHEEPPQRHLGTLRDHLTLPPDRFAALLALMQGSTAAHALIARAANRHLTKSEREAAGVLSSAQPIPKPTAVSPLGGFGRATLTLMRSVVSGSDQSQRAKNMVPCR
jgi:hypothetical protein